LFLILLRTRLLFLLIFFIHPLFGQNTQLQSERDLIDVAERFLKKPLLKRDSVKKKSGRIYFSGAPSLGYSLTSGWAGLIAANGAFYTSEEKEVKISNLYSDVVYTQNQQLVMHLQSNIWTRGNRFNLVTDWRYYSYPQKTFGLGGNTDNTFANQDYQYLRLNQILLKSIKPNLYLGGGYGLDYHWSITETEGDSSVISNTLQYGLPNHSVSSGLFLNLLYDNRLNSINPARGQYVNILVKENVTALGSNSNWGMLLIDLRHYIPFPRNSQNVLAFWSYNWLTTHGNPPYLDLPSTGWDPYSNTGRGYIQGRFRGKNMIYLESEYRFRILKSGLLGGVVFVNAQCFSEWPSNVFKTILPAAGFGARIKFNKYSKTNIAIDYGIGQNGSQGVFVNLGEVF